MRKNVIVAVATLGEKGLQDSVSHEFGHSKTFTIIEIEEGKIKNVKVIQNPAASISHGRGPLIAKKLAEMKVQMVISGEVGPGASAILKEFGIAQEVASSGQRLENALKEKALLG
ncbi:MAG: NifB/NifX family molybdenum-iron cluster-binding protein [Candidatus Bathyarchaeales archaeon]